MSKLIHLLPCFLLMNACGSSQVSNAAEAQGKSADGQSSHRTEAFAVGINVSSINWWDRNRPFMNLIYGSSWQMQGMSTPRRNQEVPSMYLDANGWVKSVPAGFRVIRELSVPLAGGGFACWYDGKGAIVIEGSAVSDVIVSRGMTRFTLKPTYPEPKSALLTYKPSSVDYIRNVDCREANASRSEALAPEFVAALSGFNVIRFLNWQTATSENASISWANRNKPGDADYLKHDGVPVELIVEIANKAGADAWVTIPWNADDDYVMRFAKYVRDNLAPGRRVYVEVSNEVWNSKYAVSAQACTEAKLERLPAVSGGASCSLERYAEKTKKVMQIWSTVFSGQTNRLIRVVSFNHRATYYSNAMLGYQSLFQSADALATAPYFGSDLTASLSFEEIMSALPAKVEETINVAVQQKAIARKYGLRYITYEGGQHIVLANNVPLLERIERDPRMYAIYKQFLAEWRDKIGDDLNLYNLVGSVSRYGAWGLSEYVGQPIAEAPKLRAVRGFLSVATSPGATISLQICSHQSTALSGVTRPNRNAVSKLGSKIN